MKYLIILIIICILNKYVAFELDNIYIYIDRYFMCIQLATILKIFKYIINTFYLLL